MLKVKTMAFPLAELFAIAKEAGAVVTVEKPGPAFNVVPANYVNSGFDARLVHALEPFVPSR